MLHRRGQYLIDQLVQAVALSLRWWDALFWQAWSHAAESSCQAVLPMSSGRGRGMEQPAFCSTDSSWMTCPKYT